MRGTVPTSILDPVYLYRLIPPARPPSRRLHPTRPPCCPPKPVVSAIARSCSRPVNPSPKNRLSSRAADRIDHGHGLCLRGTIRVPAEDRRTPLQPKVFVGAASPGSLATAGSAGRHSRAPDSSVTVVITAVALARSEPGESLVGLSSTEST